ncbi:hypothetical protein EK21DRAFT_95162 [Setomelanomma holmii]|uniref:Uncharacterized protein n=1 Tax=Setomelanomma holmii TaxID=210430 RepID=A0A9P4GX93_9PLEO|nr:hypothetical protein EK21DRAFT_95162 [Setomelanomma holmii]
MLVTQATRAYISSTKRLLLFWTSQDLATRRNRALTNPPIVLCLKGNSSPAKRRTPSSSSSPAYTLPFPTLNPPHPISAAAQRRQAFQIALDDTRAHLHTLNMRWPVTVMACDKQYAVQRDVLTKKDSDVLEKEIDELKAVLGKLRDYAVMLEMRAGDWRSG